jgi:hypothetical protein
LFGHWTDADSGIFASGDHREEEDSFHDDPTSSFPGGFAVEGSSGRCGHFDVKYTHSNA